MRTRHLIDLSPLRHSPAFARLWAGNAIAGIGSQMTIVAVGIHLYEITGSTVAVAAVGIVALVPMIFAGLIGGMLADHYDRRLVAMLAAVAAWLSTAVIAVLAWTGVEVLAAYYLLTSINAVAATVIGAVRQAILPRLLPAAMLPAAGALQGMSVGLMVTLGPALAGVLIAVVGIPWTYTLDVVLFTAAFAGIVTLPPIVPEGKTRRPGLTSVADGLRYLRRAPNIRASYLADIIAMTFGRPHALFPAIGAVLLGGGAITVGILTAAVAVGTMVSSIFSGRVGTVRRHGLAIGWSVMAFGAATLAFALVLLGSLGQPVTALPDGANWTGIALAFLALALTGAADNISMIFRMTMLQVAVPDHMRGRMQGVFMVVVTGGPRLGDLYVGLTVLAGALWFPPLLGGVLIMVLIGLLLRLQPGFRAYDALDPKP